MTSQVTHQQHFFGQPAHPGIAGRIESMTGRIRFIYRCVMLHTNQSSNSEVTIIAQAQPQWSKTHPSELAQRPPFSHEGVVANGELYLIPIYLIAFLSVLTFPLFQKLAKCKLGDAYFIRASQIPCHNCRFFNNGMYLKCAVHPSNVLTKEAIACRDYYSKR